MSINTWSEKLERLSEEQEPSVTDSDFTDLQSCLNDFDSISNNDERKMPVNSLTSIFTSQKSASLTDLTNVHDYNLMSADERSVFRKFPNFRICQSHSTLSCNESNEADEPNNTSNFNCLLEEHQFSKAMIETLFENNQILRLKLAEAEQKIEILQLKLTNSCCYCGQIKTNENSATHFQDVPFNDDDSALKFSRSIANVNGFKYNTNKGLPNSTETELSNTMVSQADVYAKVHRWQNKNDSPILNDPVLNDDAINLKFEGSANELCNGKFLKKQDEENEINSTTKQTNAFEPNYKMPNAINISAKNTNFLKNLKIESSFAQLTNENDSARIVLENYIEYTIGKIMNQKSNIQFLQECEKVNIKNDENLQNTTDGKLNYDLSTNFYKGFKNSGAMIECLNQAENYAKQLSKGLAQLGV